MKSQHNQGPDLKLIFSFLATYQVAIILQFLYQRSYCISQYIFFLTLLFVYFFLEKNLQYLYLFLLFDLVILQIFSPFLFQYCQEKNHSHKNLAQYQKKLKFLAKFYQNDFLYLASKAKLELDLEISQNDIEFKWNGFCDCLHHFVENTLNNL